MKKGENKKKERGLRALSLPRSAKGVYSVILAFSEAGSICYASQSYIAKAQGISDRSVRRALVLLCERGLIERAESDGRVGYIAVLPDEEEKVAEDTVLPDEEKKKALIRERAMRVRETGIPPLREDGSLDMEVVMASVGIFREQRERRYFEGMPERDGDVLSYIYEKRPDIQPEYKYVRLGRDGLVTMTAKQTDHLAELVSEDKLTDYISRLEALIHKSRNDRTVGPKNHYETVKKWIEEDGKL